MKKTLLKLFGLGVMTLGSTTLFAQTMYLDEMFNVSKQANIVYDSNRSVNILFGQVPGQQPIIGVNLSKLNQVLLNYLRRNDLCSTCMHSLQCDFITLL